MFTLILFLTYLRFRQNTIVLKKGALTLGLIGISLANPSIAILLLPSKLGAPSNSSLKRLLKQLNY